MFNFMFLGTMVKQILRVNWTLLWVPIGIQKDFQGLGNGLWDLKSKGLTATEGFQKRGVWGGPLKDFLIEILGGERLLETPGLKNKFCGGTLVLKQAPGGSQVWGRILNGGEHNWGQT